MPTIVDETDSLALDNLICFALYSASRALTARYRELLAPLDLTYPQYLVMLVLWSEGPVSVGSLGDRLQLDSGTLSPLLRRIEAAGLITRTRTPADERTVEIALTAKGGELRAAAQGIPAQICAATGLDLDDLAALRDQVAVIADHVRAR